MFIISTRISTRAALVAGAAMLAFTGMAHAEEPVAAPLDEAYDGEAIMVTASPIRESLEASLQIQREADNVINAITSDDAGRFPDQTVAAALARLPGIGVQRDQGQERYVQVRGAPTRWTVVSFDGVNVLGAEERIFRFDSVPAALISTVELNKTLLADMPAEALAGRVNIKTFSALDKPGFNGYLDLGYGWVDLGKGPQEQAAGRLSWGSDTFGITVAGSHSQFEQQTDNSEPRYDAAGALRELRNAKYIIEREINSLSGKIEFRPAEGHHISATSLYTEFLDHEQRNQYTFAFTGADRTGTQGTTAGANVVGAFEQGEYKTSTFVNILHGDHDMGALRASWDAAYVETKSKTDLPIITQLATDAALRPDASYTTGKYNLPVVSVTNANGTAGFLDQQAYDREMLTAYMMGSTTKSYTGKVDLAYDLSDAATLKFGGQYDDRKSVDPGAMALIQPDGQSGSFLMRDVAATLGLPWTPGAYVTGAPVKEDLNRGYVFNYLDNKGMRHQLDALIAGAREANADGANIAVPTVNPALANTVKERIIAGYVSGSWKMDALSLVAGVRVENTKVSSTGAAALGGVLTPVAISNDYTFVFPSLHVSYDATDALKLRAAFVSGAARPSFVDQRATVTINDAVGIQAVIGGNPGLKPERAFGFDASAEWYFAPASLLSVNGFYRKVKDTLFDSTGMVGDGRFNFNGVDRSGYQYTSTLNGGDGKLYGVEFAYSQPFTFLPSPFDGLGAQASLTLVDGDFELPSGRKVAFPGTSKRIANLSVFYEKAGFSARLGYQHRTRWLDDISVDATQDIYWGANERVDLSFRYQLVEGFTLYADIVNLTNEPGIRYTGTKATPYEVELFGTRYLFGVKANF
ncbi:TonB-dependent receptor [Sphingobium faniae]|nr:TonB-dependent receptor [Sphingobium faniae]